MGRRKSDREKIQSMESQLRQSILVSGLEKETSSIVSVVFPSFSTVKWDLGQRGSLVAQRVISLNLEDWVHGDDTRCHTVPLKLSGLRLPSLRRNCL